MFPIYCKLGAPSVIDIWSIMLFQIHKIQIVLHYYSYFRVEATGYPRLSEFRTQDLSHAVSPLWAFEFLHPSSSDPDELSLILPISSLRSSFSVASSMLPTLPTLGRRVLSPFLSSSPIPETVTHDSQNQIWTVSTSMLPATFHASTFFLFSLVWTSLFPLTVHLH